MYKGEGSIPAMPEAKGVTATIHNIYDVSSSRYARTLHQSANLAGAPKGFHGFKTEPLTIGNAIQFTSIGSPVEAGGPAIGSFALTIDERLDRSLFGVEAADLDGGVSREESVFPTRGFHDV